MADLGTIGNTGGLTKHYFLALDIAWARPFATNLPYCFARTGVDAFFKPRWRDQWYHLRGSVKNSSGTGIARRVLAIDNRTGALKGAATSDASGNFDIPLIGTTEALTVIAVPNSGDARNVVAYDAVLPVFP